MTTIWSPVTTKGFLRQHAPASCVRLVSDRHKRPQILDPKRPGSSATFPALRSSSPRLREGERGDSRDKTNQSGSQLRKGGMEVVHRTMRIWVTKPGIVLRQGETVNTHVRFAEQSPDSNVMIILLGTVRSRPCHPWPPRCKNQLSSDE